MEIGTAIKNIIVVKDLGDSEDRKATGICQEGEIISLRIFYLARKQLLLFCYLSYERKKYTNSVNQVLTEFINI